MALNEEKKAILSEVIESIVNISIEKFMFTSDIACQYIRSSIMFDNSYKMKFTINDNYNKYLITHYNQMKALLYILVRLRKLNVDDINEVLNAMFDDMNAVFAYTYDMLDSFTNAINMNASYYFELPNYNVEAFNRNDLKEFIAYLNGYNLDSIIYFLTNIVNIYDEDTCNKEVDNLKIMDIDKKNYNTFSGINEQGKIMVPKIKDSRSTLIVLHELIHKYLLINKDSINDDRIVYGEELPILYEMLYKDYNSCINCKIHNNKLSNVLYRKYKQEPIEEQIIKLKRLLKKTNK